MINMILLLNALILLLICSGSDSAPSRTSITARVGSSAVLPCEWKDGLSQRPHIEWRTISETVFERLGEEQFQGEGYEDRVDVPEDKLKKGNCSLVLKDIRPDDAGVYESYLLVNRVRRALKSRRVFIQSVELSVDETVKLSPESSQRLEADDATVNYPASHITAFLLLLWFFFF